MISDFYGANADMNVMIRRCLTEKLGLIQDCTKLLITFSEKQREWKWIAEIPQTLHVMCDRGDRGVTKFVTAMLEILSKRWRTLDLISIMQEVQRTEFHAGFLEITINDRLSTLPRLQKKENP